MNSRSLKITEFFIQLSAVLILILMGWQSYDLIPLFVNETKYAGELVLTNSHMVFWHFFAYTLDIFSWFVFYYLIFERFRSDLKKKLVFGLIGWGAVTLIQILLTLAAGNFLHENPLPETVVFEVNVFRPFASSIFFYNLLLGGIAFLTHSTLQFLHRYNDLKNADRVQAELISIRSQLRPHFYFNTLNNLYSMALESGNEPLATGIQNLTGMMRHTLDHSGEERVSLEKEWEYIRRYIELQKLRLAGGQTEIRVSESGDLKGKQIAPMILINFVENAFKHGVSNESASFINISLSVSGEQITLEVENSAHPSSMDQGQSGIGTAQTRKLLELNYPDAYTLKEVNQDRIFHIKLIVPAE